MNQIETEEYMRRMARGLDAILTEDFGEKTGFVILLFEFGAPGITNYISNASREDMLKAFRETLKRFEKGEIMPPVIPIMQ